MAVEDRSFSRFVVVTTYATHRPQGRLARGRRHEGVSIDSGIALRRHVSENGIDQLGVMNMLEHRGIAHRRLAPVQCIKSLNRKVLID